MDALSRRLYAAAQVRELDRRAIEEHGIASYELMQRAARACWEAAIRRWPQAHRIAVFCGVGNNGGDGYEIARLARARGCEVQAIAVDGLPRSEAAVQAAAAWRGDGGLIEAFGGAAPDADLVFDAILGTGLARAPRGEAVVAIRAIERLRQRGAAVVAVDVPSGLDASSGLAFEPAVQADLCVSFIGNKFGLYAGQGPALAGERHFDRLSVPDGVYVDLPPQAVLQDASDLCRVLPPRERGAHKGLHGHVLIIGGNLGMLGAALLAGRAALRSGAGLVSVATQPAHAAAMAAAQPELMCRGVADAAALRPLLARADVVAIGPGLGMDDWAQALWTAALDSGKPLVIDADALNLLALHVTVVPEAVLTPHPGEAARLLGCSALEIQRDRLGSLLALQSRYGCSVVLKGAGSLSGGELPRLCPYGNPGMAVGGSGDVLTGVVAALRAQGLEAAAAASTGVLAHALAGDAAAAGGERGLLPGDLIAQLQTVVNPRP